MEITLSPPVQPQLPTQTQTNGTEHSSAPLLQKAAVQPTKKVEEQSVATNPDQQKGSREAAVKKAAEDMFKGVFPVSDVTFSIYKDSSGQYVTRFTSLRDGRVTYIPEQDMFAYLKRAGRQYNNVKLDA